jgi:hypothetical protein
LGSHLQKGIGRSVRPGTGRGRDPGCASEETGPSRGSTVRRRVGCSDRLEPTHRPDRRPLKPGQTYPSHRVPGWIPSGLGGPKQWPWIGPLSVLFCSVATHW